MTLFMAFCAVRTLKLVSRDDPFFSMITMEKDEQIAIDLWKNNFAFAIEAVDPKIGRIDVRYFVWGEQKLSKSIQMVDCKTLLDQPDFEQMHKSRKLLVQRVANSKRDHSFLCPVNLESLKVRGSYGSSNFDYLQI